MPTPNVFLTGKIALLNILRTDNVVGSGVLPVISAQINVKMETPDASSYASGGFIALVPGIMSAEITAEIAYDKTAMAPIFAGMKADVELTPTGNNAGYLASLPNSTQASLVDEYQSSGASYLFPNCTVTQVTYDVAVKDIQKIKVTLIPSAAPSVNFVASF